METWLNKDILRSWTPEQRGEYQRNIQQQMAQLAIFHSQIVEVRVEEGDYGKS
jgi:hypothetical protein